MKFLDKWNIKRLSPRKLLITGAAITIMTVVTFLTLVAAAKWEVTVKDNGSVITLQTTKSTVEGVLKEANVLLAPEDIVIPASDTPISEARQIEIRRAFNITVLDKDSQRAMRTAAATVEGALEQCKIELGEYDEVDPPLTSSATPEMLITITRVDVSEITVEEEIGYDVVEEKSDEIAMGVKKLVTSGANGLANIKYRVITKNGVEETREEISREILREPVNKVIAVGTRQGAVPVATLASRSGSAPVSASKVIICRATAYDGSYETLGYSNPKTALGRTPTVGTVAVDPKVIPLGTRMYIETVDGSYVYGECFAGDTGGAIKGNRVDLFMASRAQALKFGSRQVRVYILD